ncbi:MAG: hypothetical protein ACUVR3_07440, partial [Candidatus Roseilinea sp.]|uniref:hypothetical protein n=1 Tax=Candidatus Roseilinea sp. TaxID=2838777 RepID=UPI004049C9BB
LSLAACCASPVAQHALPSLKEALAMIRVGGAVAGVHCCARLPTALVCQAHPDLISFDAHQGLEEFVADPHMQTFMQAGGLVAFGLIPTALDLSAFQPLTLLSRWLESALTVGNIADLAKRSLFTATCGLGLVSEQAMRQSFQLARQLSASVTTLLQRAARNPSAPDSSTPAPRLRRPHPYTAFHLWKKKTD